MQVTRNQTSFTGADLISATFDKQRLFPEESAHIVLSLNNKGDADLDVFEKLAKKHSGLGIRPDRIISINALTQKTESGFVEKILVNGKEVVPDENYSDLFSFIAKKAKFTNQILGAGEETKSVSTYVLSIIDQMAKKLYEVDYSQTEQLLKKFHARTRFKV